MRESGQIMRECLGGLLKTMRPATESDIDALRELQRSTRGAREGTASYLQSIRGGKKATARLRKQNFSASINESSTRLQEHLKDSARTVRRTIRGLRAGRVSNGPTAALVFGHPLAGSSGSARTARRSVLTTIRLHRLRGSGVTRGGRSPSGSSLRQPSLRLPRSPRDSGAASSPFSHASLEREVTGQQSECRPRTRG